MRFLLFIFAIIISGAASTVLASPDIWSRKIGVSTTDYTIHDTKKVAVTLTCMTLPDDNDILQHRVRVVAPNGESWDSHDENTNISLFVGGHQYPVPFSLDWRHGEIEWLQFIDALTTASAFVVRVDNTQNVASFSPGLKNTKAVLADLRVCKRIRYDG